MHHSPMPTSMPVIAAALGALLVGAAGCKPTDEVDAAPDGAVPTRGDVPSHGVAGPEGGVGPEGRSPITQDARSRSEAPRPVDASGPEAVSAGRDGAAPTRSAPADLAPSVDAAQRRRPQATKLSREFVYTDATGADGSTANTDWSDYLSWDPPTQRVLYAGAGHLRPYKFMVYSAGDNTWRAPGNLAPCMLLSGYSGCFNHGYHNGT